MSNLHYSFGVLFLLFFSFSHSNSNTNEWKKVTKTEFWTVYTRTSETSDIKEVKVEGIMHAGFDAVKEAMSDIPSYPDWVYSCIDSYKFDEVSDNEFFSYTKTDLPFPLKHRDLVVYSTLETTKEDEWHSTSDARPTRIPSIESAVRITKYHAEWKMTLKDEMSIDFVYSLAMEPGGILPAWIVNLAIAKIPINTISALEKRSISIMNK